MLQNNLGKNVTGVFCGKDVRTDAGSLGYWDD